MPTIRGIYNINPNTLQAGLWIEFSSSPPNTYVGVTQAQINSFIPQNLTPQTAETFRANLESTVQNFINNNHPQGLGSLNAKITIRSVNPLLWGILLT